MSYAPPGNPKIVQEDHPMYCLDCPCLMAWVRLSSLIPISWNPKSLIKNSTCLGVPLFILFKSSIPHQSFLLPACPTHVPSHLQNIPTYRHNCQTSVSSFKILFGGRGMDWGQLEFRELVRQWLRQTFRNRTWLRLLVLRSKNLPQLWHNNHHFLFNPQTKKQNFFHSL